MADGAVMDLLMVIPTRGRPHNIERLLEALQRTCRAETKLVLGLDADDPALPGYVAMWPHVAMGWLPRAGTYGEVRPAGRFGYDIEVCDGLRQVTAWVNHLAVPRAAGYRAVGHFGDDNVPQTDGWDERMLAALEKTPFAFGNDRYPRQPGSLPCHIFMRSVVVKALGYMSPPAIRHIADLAWNEWGRACGITYLDDVIIEHLHWSVGEAPMDEVYAAVNAIDAEDNARFRAYAAAGLQADIDAIMAAL